ncbi:MAG: GerMN domain-containing protein [Oscillospiraceae bacterium]|jgi:hypothetical protein|nr:GerMN domain-containing protein [Oscillospiraceae bacterium]
MNKKHSFKPAALCLLALLLTACAAQTPAPEEATAPPDAMATEWPDIAPNADAAQAEMRMVSLYYRLREEDLLARETRSVYVPMDKQLETVLVEALIEGPSPSLLDLTGLFIPGTKVIETARRGDLVTITLSDAFLGTPVDAPIDWRGNPLWQGEVFARRRLALASIVNTLTEAGDCARVQVLVRQGGEDSAGIRIARSDLYEEAAPGDLLTPLTRDESLLLTHHRTADVIMACWQNRDFERLYRFVSGRPTQPQFLQEMGAREHFVTDYTLSAGTVSADGMRAVVACTFAYEDGAGMAEVTEYPIRLLLENGLWKINYEALLALLEAI